MTAAHVGNNDLVGASIAGLGLPLNVVADDSAFPELFDYLRAQREQWHATLIPWRNLRAIFGVLRRRELLGLLVDWGYRSDGIPVKLFDAWTTLPAGPATLAAKTSSRIVPAITTRQKDGRVRVVLAEPISVASSDPADLQRATQAIADAVAESIRPAPEQWYSFKPIWPATEAEAADLERRALAMQAGRPDPGPVPRSAARRGRPGRGGPGRSHAMTIRGRLMLDRLVAGLPPAGRPALRVRRADRRALVPADARPRRAGPAQPAAGRAGPRRVRTRERLGAGRRHATRRALERLVRSAYRHAARYYVEVARNPSVTPAFVDERLALDTPELIAEAVVPGKAVLFVGLHFGSVEMAVIFLAFRVGETVTPMETIDDAGLQAYFERTRGVAGIRLVGLREARRELTRRAPQRHPGRARRRPRPDRRRDPRSRSSEHLPSCRWGRRCSPSRPACPTYGDDRPARGGGGPFPRQDHPDRCPRRGDAPRTGDDHDDPPGRRVRGPHRRRPRPVVGGLLPDLAGSRGGGGARRRRAARAPDDSPGARGAAA